MTAFLATAHTCAIPYCLQLYTGSLVFCRGLLILSCVQLYRVTACSLQIATSRRACRAAAVAAVPAGMFLSIFRARKLQMPSVTQIAGHVPLVKYSTFGVFPPFSTQTWEMRIDVTGRLPLTWREVPCLDVKRRTKGSPRDSEYLDNEAKGKAPKRVIAYFSAGQRVADG